MHLTLCTFDSILYFVEQTMLKNTAIVMVATAATAQGTYPNDGCEKCCDMNIILGKLAEMTGEMLPLLENHAALFEIAKTTNSYIENVNQLCDPAVDLELYPENQAQYCALFTTEEDCLTHITMNVSLMAVVPRT